MILKIKNLKVIVGGPSFASSYAKATDDKKASDGKKEILKGVNLEVGAGEVHVVMGPNGSGKSTLANVIAGHPGYKIESGELRIDNKIINKLSPDKRAKLGIFLGFQNPIEIPGVSVFNVIRKANQALLGSAVKNRGPVGSFSHSTSSVNTKSSGKTKTNGNLRALSGRPSTAVTPRLDMSAFRQDLLKYAESLKLSENHLSRSFNEGFSGGEKKRNEILQMLALSPKLVILDEIDSGLDVDGLKLVAGALKQFRHNDPVSSLILITHYARILRYLKADFVHVMSEGKIVKSGKQKLASEIEEHGYQGLANVIARSEATKQSKKRSPRSAVQISR